MKFFFKKFSCLCLLFLLNNAFAKVDFGQEMQGTANSDNFGEIDNKRPEDFNLMGSRKDNFDPDIDSDSVMLSGHKSSTMMTDELSLKKSHIFNGGHGDYDKQSSTFIEEDVKDSKYQVRNSSKTAFSFAYFRDDFSYSDSRNVYKRTFDEGSKTRHTGYLIVNLQRFLTKKYIDTSLVFGGGLSYNQGLGVFSNNTKSNAVIKLWCIPVDVGFAIGLPLSRFFSIEGSAGPSAMLIWQNRSDRDDSERGQEYRQFSTGVFYAGKFKISMSDFSDRMFRKLFSEYGVTKSYFNLEARGQSYSKFKNDFSVSGNSFGIGFTFEYL